MAAPVDDALSAVRSRVAGTIRSMVSGDRSPPPPRIAGSSGALRRRLLTWRVHSDTAMFIGGLRALLLQTLHPLAMAGVAQHSDYRSDPWGRLRRTGQFIGVTTFGSEADAEAMIGRVRRIHDRVRGTAPDGRPYEANDPHLLAWVHATEVDSFLAAYQHYGGDRLDRTEADRYVAEMSVIARRLGADPVPESVAELRSWIESVRPELIVGRDAREAVGFLLAPPVPPRPVRSTGSSERRRSGCCPRGRAASCGCPSCR
jgi:uncharacterized protein (DUF2236 family)